MIQGKVQVLWNNKIGPSYYRIGLKCDRGYSDAKPGQFIMLRLSDQIAPLLRRPFSIHRLITSDGGIKGIEILYKVVGKCTTRLSLCKNGDIVDILGPLGNGFSIPSNYNRIFIVAGGIGVAPMLFLVSFLKEKNIDVSAGKVFLGGRTKDDLLCKDEFLRCGMTVHITTDDGSAGERCFVTHPLETAVKETPPDIIYACGPLQMLKCVVNIAEKYEVPCQVSIETIMACGMGACLGCAVEGKETFAKYMHACVDGPVFDARKLKMDT